MCLIHTCAGDLLQDCLMSSRYRRYHYGAIWGFPLLAAYCQSAFSFRKQPYERGSSHLRDCTRLKVSVLHTLVCRFTKSNARRMQYMRARMFGGSIIANQSVFKTLPGSKYYSSNICFTPPHSRRKLNTLKSKLTSVCMSCIFTCQCMLQGVRCFPWIR